MMSAGKSLYKVLELHLQHDVHTSLEVKSKVNLLVLYLLVGITEINYF